MRQFGWVYLILLALLTACGQDPAGNSKPPSFFSNIHGIPFTEVRRSFDNGLSFDQQGFQLEPAWKMNFLSDDSVRLYNSLDKRSYHFHIHYDNNEVINMARVWLRVKAVSRDSLKFQLLQVAGKKIAAERSNIYMTFYADHYIRKALGTNAEDLRKPNRRDSLFIRNKIKKAANRTEHAFAAREPVVLSSKSTAIKVEKLKVNGDPLSQGLSHEYLSPEYKIRIKPAYRDFYYSFTVTVDTLGKMHYGQPTVYIMPEFEESQKQVMKGIMEVYLQNLLDIQPGKTLGMKHPSVISLHVKGTKVSGKTE